MPIDPGPTRQRIIDAATRLMAEHGVDRVSLAEINRAAGQRNASALQYHFGGRAELLRAILAPFASTIRARRRELLAFASDGGLASRAEASDAEVCDAEVCDAVRRAVEVLVRPHAEFVTGGWRERSLARIVADLFTDPHHSYAEFDDLLGERATGEMSRLLVSALPDLPPLIRVERLRVASAFVVHATSDWARRADLAAARGEPPPPAGTVELFVENLIDMVVGALTAPVSALAGRHAEQPEPSA